MIRSGQVGRVIAYPSLVLFLVGNVYYTSDLLHDGRGQYREMVRDIAERTTGPLVTVASEQDFRNRMVIDFYRRDVADKRIVYVPSERAQDIAPMWLVLNYLSRSDQMDPQLIGPRGDRYILEQTYPSGLLSGWHLALYRKTAAEEADSTTRPE